MENQINIGDKNTQQIGQNPIKQPSVSPTSEKLKIKHLIILTIITIAIFIGFLGWLFWGKIVKNNFLNNVIRVSKPTTSLPTQPSEKQKINYVLDKPYKTLYEAFFITNKAKELYIKSVTGSSEINKHFKEGAFRDALLQSLKETKNSFYFLKSNKLYKYAKSSKEIVTIEFPKSVNNNSDNEESLSFNLSELSSSKLLISLFANYSKKGTFIYDENSNNWTPVSYFNDSCKSVYCGSPTLLDKLSESEYLFMQSGGDACWWAGTISYFNLDTISAKKVLQFKNGCGNSDSLSYIGVIDGKIFMAQQILQENNDIGVNASYESLYTVNPISGEKTLLISKQAMPKDINRMQVDESKMNIILSDSSGNQHSFNLADNKLTKLEEKEKQLTQEESDKVAEEKLKEFSDKNKDDIVVSITKIPVTAVKNVKYDYYTLAGTDSDGDLVSFIAIYQIYQAFDEKDTNTIFYDFDKNIIKQKNDNEVQFRIIKKKRSIKPNETEVDMGYADALFYLKTGELGIVDNNFK